MAKLIMSVQGSDGMVELVSDRIVIHRSGLMNMVKYGWHSKREIPLSSISSINFRDASAMKFGEISFEYAGRRSDGGKSQDNTVLFSKKRQPEFRALKEKIFEILASLRK